MDAETRAVDSVDVYPVGVLRHLQHAWRYLVARGFPGPKPIHPVRWRLGNARAALRGIPRAVGRHIRKRQWRELKNDFNGYLAEPYHWPEDGSLTRCGTGWTKARAMRSLRRRGWRH